ncbi:MarR family transcriptional regulator [Shinella zoogloeoides]|uniref:MarR family winged helix-turn-helix transcriptional regulator n=1 Tax=Shinella zoogloeoides TaxID=352475 RepID=UPI0028A6400D|nr:MarR family transcriptional regulator [Shinella zoogloeoides]
MTSNPMLPLSSNRLGTLVSLVSRQWRKAVDARLQAFGLSEATWLPLLRLAQAGKPMRQKDLAAVLTLDTSSVVRILANLDAAGLIEQHPDEEDRRAKAITVTEAGRALVRQVESVSQGIEDEVLADIAQGDLATSRRVLEQVCGRLLAMNESDRKS